MGLLWVFRVSAASKGYSKSWFLFCTVDFESRITVKQILQTMYCFVLFCSRCNKRFAVQIVQMKKKKKNSFRVFFFSSCRKKWSVCSLNGFKINNNNNNNNNNNSNNDNNNSNNNNNNNNSNNNNNKKNQKCFFLFWTICTANGVCGWQAFCYFT